MAKTQLYEKATVKSLGGRKQIVRLKISGIREGSLCFPC